MDIRHTAVLITGASRASGPSWASPLLPGVPVVLVARDPARCPVVAEIRAAGGEAHALPATSPTRTDHAIAAPPRAGGPHRRAGAQRLDLGPVPMPLLLDTACEDLSRRH